MPDVIIIPFLFALGACVGSFLNVVVWRLPRNQSLVSPPSHCPKCNQRLRWYDNIPVIGWIKLGGKCRFCREAISIRYPIVEFVMGALFVFYYVMFFHYQIGPCPPRDVLGNDEFGMPVFVQVPLEFWRDWPIYFLYMFTISALLAASLIDAELCIIPLEIPWLMAVVGMLVHTLVDHPTLPGALNINAPAAAMALGSGIGLLLSLLLLRVGVLKRSFPQGEPLLEIDRRMLTAEAEQAKREGRSVEQPQLPPPYTKNQIRWEMRHEVLFLLPPLLLGGVTVMVMMLPSIRQTWEAFSTGPYAGGFFGSLLGALVGGAVVWVTRILGTLGFGRVAMGLGDVHLMLGLGAVLGSGAVTVAFFLAPFFGILFAIYKLITRTGRELPYGPFLGMAGATVMLFYCPIAHWLKPGMQGLGLFVRQAVGE